MKRILAKWWALTPVLACLLAAGCNRGQQQAMAPKTPEVLVGYPVVDTITDYEYFTGRSAAPYSRSKRSRSRSG